MREAYKPMRTIPSSLSTGLLRSSLKVGGHTAGARVRIWQTGCRGLRIVLTWRDAWGWHVRLITPDLVGDEADEWWSGDAEEE